MTGAEDTTRPAPETDAPARAGRWKLAAGLAVGLALLATGVAAFALARDDDSPPSTMPQIAAAHQACNDWLDSGDAPRGNGPRGNGSRGAWCEDMTSWMTDHMPQGPGMMGVSMRWDDPEAMRDACIRATGADGTGGDDATDSNEWCDQMADWMSGHMADGDE